jgi:hypothetical protein
MNLYRKWISLAYDKKGATNPKCWNEFTSLEQNIYEHLLDEKINHLEGDVQDLAARFKMSSEYFCGFLDGINEALEKPLELESVEPETFITLDFEFARLYQKMVEYRAEHLCALPQWRNIFAEEELDDMYKTQRQSTTVTRTEVKTGRNDPCPCGSGKKYKRCCGAQTVSA